MAKMNFANQFGMLQKVQKGKAMSKVSEDLNECAEFHFRGSEINNLPNLACSFSAGRRYFLVA